MAKAVYIALDNCINNICYPGQTLAGRVECSFDKEETVRGIRIKFTGKANTTYSRSRTIYSSEQVYFDQEYNLLQGEDEIHLDAGRHTYPFSYILPATLPSSFVGEYGIVRYNIKATVDRSWKFNYEDELLILVYSPLNLNFVEGIREPKAVSAQKAMGRWYCRADPLIFNMCLPATGYAIGQQINIGASIRNLSNVSVDCVKFKIVQVIRFIANQPSGNEIQQERVFTSCAVGDIGTRRDLTWTTSLLIPNANFVNLTLCRIINSTYRLEAEVVLPFPYSNLTTDGIPITIGTTPLSGMDMEVLGQPPASNSIATAPLADSYSVNNKDVLLYIMANTVKIILDNVVGAFYPGQTLSGRVECFFEEEKKVRAVRLRFKGCAKTRWSRSSGKSSTVYRAKEVYFDQAYNLIGGGEDFELNAGRHTYPFSYILPASLPASFEGIYGKVRYTIKATVDRPWKIDYTEKIALNVFTPFDLNLMPAFRNPNAISVEKEVRSLCCQTNPITLNISVPITGYAIGQQIDVRAAIKNMSNVTIENVQFRIMRVLQFISHEPYNRENYDEYPITSCAVGAIGAHADMEWTSSLTVPRDSCINLFPCNIINVEYHLEVEAKLPFPHSNLTGNFPIAIGSVPYSDINVGPIHPPQQQTNFYPPYSPNSYPSNAGASAPLIASHSVNKSSSPSEKASIGEMKRLG